MYSSVDEDGPEGECKRRSVRYEIFCLVCYQRKLEKIKKDKRKKRQRVKMKIEKSEK